MRRTKYIRSTDYRVSGKGIALRDENPDHDSEVFEVVGAGFITFGESSIDRCGTATGCSVDTSWSKYGYCGGVMDISEMERLLDADGLVGIYVEGWK